MTRPASKEHNRGQRQTQIGGRRARTRSDRLVDWTAAAAARFGDGHHPKLPTGFIRFSSRSATSVGQHFRAEEYHRESLSFMWDGG